MMRKPVKGIVVRYGNAKMATAPNFVSLINQANDCRPWEKILATRWFNYEIEGLKRTSKTLSEVCRAKMIQ